MNAELKEKLENIKSDSAYRRFIKLLYEMFELDKGDLDFGIYKILNVRRDKIIEFLNGTGSYEEKGLPQQIIEALELVSSGDKASIEKEIEESTNKLKELGMNDEQINESTKIKELKEKLNKGSDLTSLQIEIYNNLYEFFSRYYDEGDFISKRRYKKDVYAIPYNGEEVKLTWANEDQYYIKTASNFNNYVFKVNDSEGNEWKIGFKVVNATVEKNNNKENAKRIFMLYNKDIDENEDKKETIIIDKSKREILINFIYDYPQTGYKNDVTKEGISKVDSGNYEKNKCYIDILNKLSKDKSIENISTILFRKDIESGKNTINIFGKNLIKFFGKNQFDFFIHKDLKGFLNRELDFYIKAEIMNLDDIENNTNNFDFEKYLVKIKVIKKIAKAIIDFLAEIEDFQKKMYLKKKFVVDTNYIITMDYIVGNNELMKEVLKNKNQLKEWEEYYDLKEILQNIDIKNEEHLNAIKYLPIDTEYFNKDFKEIVLASINECDMKISGNLYNCDNFQQINLVKNKYNDSIKLIYIDPPYNRGGNDFNYKDSYKSSSWNSMIYDRLEYVKSQLRLNGVIFISIDDNQFNYLYKICEDIFGSENVDVMIWRKSGASRDGKMKNTTTFRKDHEYIIVVFNNNKVLNKSYEKPNWLNEYGNPDNDPRGNYKQGLIYKTEDNPNSDNYYTVISPTGRKITKQFDFSKDIFEKLNQDNRIYWGKKGDSMPSQKIFENENRYVTTSSMLFDDNKKIITTFDDLTCTTTIGTKELENIIGDEDVAKKLRPKPTSLISKIIQISSEKGCFVLDFFAGSGTTGESCIYNNRKFEELNMKYILVEMGEYFDTVLVPRIKKVIYCNDWKDGKPKNRNTGVSQIVKYQTIESYEDTLNNIDVNSLDTLLNPDYIKYSFDLKNEDILQNKIFEKPFEYKMNIQIDNEIKNVNIDLIETFNYLIGLYVDRSFVTKEIDGLKHKLIVGNLRTGERTAIIWRDIDKNENNSNKAINKFISENLKCLIDAESIYLNGDASLEIFELEGKEIDLNSKTQITEEKFKKEMFSYEEF